MTAGRTEEAVTDVPAPRAAVAPGAEPRSLGARLLGPQRRNLWFWLFVGPFAIGLGLFTYVPLVWSVYLSFFDAHNTVSPAYWTSSGWATTARC